MHVSELSLNTSHSLLPSVNRVGRTARERETETETEAARRRKVMGNSYKTYQDNKILGGSTKKKIIPLQLINDAPSFFSMWCKA